MAVLVAESLLERVGWICRTLIRVTFEGTDPLTVLPDILALVPHDHRGRYATVLSPDWASRSGDRVRRCRVALPGLRRLGPAHHHQLRGRDTRGDRPRRRHGHCRRGDRRPRGGVLRAGRNPHPLVSTTPCPPTGLRRTGFWSWQTCFTSLTASWRKAVGETHVVAHLNGELVVWEADRMAFERLQQSLARRSGAGALAAARTWPAHLVSGVRAGSRRTIHDDKARVSAGSPPLVVGGVLGCVAGQ
ncbi:hypothetical protein EV562_12030 [Streptomyces sp. BK208]|nr:hypothetical protein EV562_12030 [Streptomyces sp. BK208]